MYGAVWCKPCSRVCARPGPCLTPTAFRACLTTTWPGDCCRPAPSDWIMGPCCCWPFALRCRSAPCTAGQALATARPPTPVAMRSAGWLQVGAYGPRLRLPSEMHGRTWGRLGPRPFAVLGRVGCRALYGALNAIAQTTCARLVLQLHCGPIWLLIAGISAASPLSLQGPWPDPGPRPDHPSLAASVSWWDIDPRTRTAPTRNRGPLRTGSNPTLRGPAFH